MTNTHTKSLVASALAFICLGAAARAEAVASAEIYTADTYRYGKFEARVQYAPGDGVVSSFFLWKPMSELPETYWNELDFEKVKGSCTLVLNSLYGLPEASHTSEPTVPSNLCGSYHTYTFEWTPTYIAWFVDGAEVRRDTGNDAQVYVDHAAVGMHMNFNVWPGNIAFAGTFSPGILPVHEYISWVSYSEYTPGAGDDGSDFSLAFRHSFENGIPSGWLRGSWPSPHGQSTHSTANVTAVNGVVVLSLTADDATGFTGTPPVDPGDEPSTAGTTGTGGTTNAGGTTGSGGTGVSVGGTAAGGTASGGSPGTGAVGGTTAGGTGPTGVGGSTTTGAGGTGTVSAGGTNGAGNADSERSATSSGCALSAALGKGNAPRHQGPLATLLAALLLVVTRRGSLLLRGHFRPR